jgi:hypothetical protein
VSSASIYGYCTIVFTCRFVSCRVRARPSPFMCDLSLYRLTPLPLICPYTALHPYPVYVLTPPYTLTPYMSLHPYTLIPLNSYIDGVTFPSSLHVFTLISYSGGGSDNSEVWGDGDVSNGSAPGHPTDIFVKGDVIVLESERSYDNVSMHVCVRVCVCVFFVFLCVCCVYMFSSKEMSSCWRANNHTMV